MELDDFSRDILTRMQPNVYHVNGSIRGKLAITEAEVDELKADYDTIKARIDGGFKGFVPPGGHPTSSQLHLCRCQAKKVVRALVAVEHSGKKQPDSIWVRYSNLLATVL